MPRQARLDIPGLVYHVMARGIERREIFRDDKDRESFLERLGKVITEGEAQLYAWTLLSNHFHLLLRRGRRPLAEVMRRLMTGHAVRYNLRHDRTGHLFQNRYKSIVVEEEAYFLELVRYTHLNGVRAGLVGSLEELDRYPFSGHSVIVGARSAPWQAVDDVLMQFADRRAEAVRRYRAFIAAGWDQGRREELRGGGLVRSAGGREALARRKPEDRQAADERILGEGSFVEDVWEEEERVATPTPKRHWEEILQEVAAKEAVREEQILGASRERRVARARREFLLRCVEEAGLSMAELARLCAMSHVCVRRAVVQARGMRAEGQ